MALCSSICHKLVLYRNDWIGWAGFCIMEAFFHPSYTHTRAFNGPFSRTTQVSRYQKGKTNLDFTEARDSEWQWHQLSHMQVCTLLQTDSHTSTHHSIFYRPDALPATQPTASKHWRHPALCCKEIRVFPKIRVLPLSLCPKLWTLIILPQQVNLVVNKTCPWSSFVVYTYDTWCSTTKLHWYNVPCTCRLTGWAKKIWTFLRVDT